MRRAVCTLALILFPNLAGAAPGRYDKPVQVPTVREARAPAPAPRPKGQEETLTADEFLKLQGRLQDIADDLIAEHRALIDETDDDDPEMPDLLYRLAELCAQKQRYLRFEAMERKPKSRARKQLLAQHRAWLLEAIKTYKRLADEPRYADYDQMDAALFYYGYTLRAAGYAKPARAIFRRLIKDYPTSPYLPDAYATFADHYFEQGQLAAAEKFYDKVLEFPKASVYAYAKYKKGWVQVNRAEHDAALRTFYEVVELTRTDERKQNLYGLARGAFVRAYAEVGKPKYAHKAFARVDADGAQVMLERLAELYQEHGAAEKAIYALRELISLAPDDPNVCRWQHAVTRTMLTTGSEDQRAKELERLTDLYRHAAEAKSLPKAALRECRDDAQLVMTETIRLWHNEAEKTQNEQTRARVDRLYRRYLGAFPNADDAAEMELSYAELLWSRAAAETKRPRLAVDKWQRAARQYEEVLERGAVKRAQMKYAAYGMVLAWKNALDVDPATQRPPPPQDTDAVPKPRAIPDRQQRLVDAYRKYRGYIDRSDADYAGMLFLEGRMLWRYDHHAAAAKLFAEVLREHRRHEASPDALVLLLDSLAKLHRYDKMIRWIERAEADETFVADHADLLASLDDSLVWALRRGAERLEQDGRYVECGELYRTIAQRKPAAAGMDEVLYNGGVCYERGKSLGLAIFMRERLIEKFPGSTHAKRALVRLGSNYGSIARYADAAQRFEEYATRFAGEKDAPNAMEFAVAYRKGLGQMDEAIDDIEQFVRAYSKRHPAQAAAALFSMTSIFEQRGDAKKVAAHLRRYLKQLGAKGGIDRRIVAHAKLGELLWKASCPVEGIDGACASRRRVAQLHKRRQVTCRSGERYQVHARKPGLVKQARKELERALALYDGGKAEAQVPGADADERDRRTRGMIHWVAAARFYLAQPAYEEFLAVEFPGTSSKEKLAAYKKLKDSKLLAAKRELDEVVAVHGGGADWAVAAAALIGELYHSYADELLTAEIPAKLRRGKFARDAMDTYCDDLAALTDVLEDESMGGYEFCLEQTTERSTINAWSELCERRLAAGSSVSVVRERHAAPTALGRIRAHLAPIPFILSEPERSATASRRTRSAKRQRRAEHSQE